MTEIRTTMSYLEAERIVSEAEAQVDQIIKNPAEYRPTEVETLLNSCGAGLTSVRLMGLPNFLPQQQASLVHRVLPLLDRMQVARDLLVEPHRVDAGDGMSIIFDADLPPL